MRMRKGMGAMTTDNRTNKYAAFLARQNHQRDSWRGVGAKCLCGKVFDLDADHALHQVEEILCAALEAATRVPVQGEPNDDREAILRKALEHVREVGESGLAGPYVHDLPKDVDSNWGWLQTMWPVVVAVDIALASRTTAPDAATGLSTKKKQNQRKEEK